MSSIVLLTNSVRHVLDFMFPPECALCGEVDFLNNGQVSVYCPGCTEKLCPQPINRCRCCGAEIGPYSKSDKGCTHCRRRKLRFKSVVCLGMYEGSLRQAVLSAKWSISAVQVRSLARLLALHRLADLQALKIDRGVPVPQHWRQRIVRHFNPAWVIASEIAAGLGKPCDPHLLRRQRRTRPQKRVSVSERFTNQTDAFAIKDPQVVQGERVLLVDDVLTTGATCSEVAKLLRASGAASCHVAVLGRVLDHSA